MVINSNEIQKIEFGLDCSLEHAIDLLSHSVESAFLPWFVSKSKIKGFITGNTFLVWPNTLYSGLLDIVIEGELIEKEGQTLLSAKARLLPPFRWFPSKTAINWLSGITMVLAWFGLLGAMFGGKEMLHLLFAAIFVISCLYNLIQFNRYVQNPELVDFENQFINIFREYINNFHL